MITGSKKTGLMANQELAVAKKGADTVNSYISSVSHFFDGIDELRRASIKGDSTGWVFKLFMATLSSYTSPHATITTDSFLY